MRLGVSIHTNSETESMTTVTGRPLLMAESRASLKRVCTLCVAMVSSSRSPRLRNAGTATATAREMMVRAITSSRRVMPAQRSPDRASAPQHRSSSSERPRVHAVDGLEESQGHHGHDATEPHDHGRLHQGHHSLEGPLRLPLQQIRRLQQKIRQPAGVLAQSHQLGQDGRE